jgi:MFS family permease
MYGASRVLLDRTFASVRLHRNYRLFFGGQMVSLVGTWIQKVAQAWLVLDLTHSSVALGVLAACQFAPYAVFGLLGGGICDRLDNHRTLIGTQTASMACAAAITLLLFTTTPRVWEIDAIAALQGLVLVLDTPARQSFTIQMVGREQLPNAIALNSTILNAARAIGPALGGLAIASIGLRWCFLLNALSYLPVVAGLLLMRRDELHRPARAAAGGSILRGVLDALRMAATTPPVRLIMTLLLTTAVLGTNFDVVLPLLARRGLHEGPEVLGILFACFGIGALLGALLAATKGRASGATLLGSALAFGTMLLVLALLRSVVGCAAILLCAGAAFSLFTSNANAMLQLTVPDHFRGRMLALYGYCWMGTAPLGGMMAGWLCAYGGPGLPFAAGGGAICLVVLLAVVVRYGRSSEWSSPP